MRSNKEILEVFLSNQHEFRTGLCNWAFSLFTKNLITNEEYNNIICRVNGYMRDEDIDLLFAWDAGVIEPRIKWLKETLI